MPFLNALGRLGIELFVRRPDVPVHEGAEGSKKQLLMAVISVGVTQSSLSHFPAKTVGKEPTEP